MPIHTSLRGVRPGVRISDMQRQSGWGVGVTSHRIVVKPAGRLLSSRLPPTWIKYHGH